MEAHNENQLEVAPYTGAWIEICYAPITQTDTRSLPTRERGLKYMDLKEALGDELVAPYTGAWIEIKCHRWQRKIVPKVAPSTRAWIEIMQWRASGMAHTVAPYTGAWIEI